MSLSSALPGPGLAYRVSLPVFEGPFDLLLQLIERERLDISVVSLAAVADQFLEHIAREETLHAQELADFLVVAARLVLIKTRLLLPQPMQATEEEEEDPAETLARQLREYKRFREAAAMLRAIEESGRRSYGRDAPLPELERRLEPGEASLEALLAAAQAAFTALPDRPVPTGVVVPFTLTIQDQIRLIRQATTGGKAITFRSLVQRASHRLEIVVTLLAILELIKRNQVAVTQLALFGEIEIAPVPGAQITEEEPADFQNGQ